jgi:hypothetical protein
MQYMTRKNLTFTIHCLVYHKNKELVCLIYAFISFEMRVKNVPHSVNGLNLKF